MIDSGATVLFLSHHFVEKHQLEKRKLDSEIIIQNIDGTLNREGTITHYIRLKLKAGESLEEREFLVTDIGPEDVIIGLSWLREHNPHVNWKEGTMKFDEVPPVSQVPLNRKNRRKWVRTGLMAHTSKEVWIAAGYTYSQAIAEEAGKEKQKKTFEEIVPEEYWGYAKVFSEH